MTTTLDLEHGPDIQAGSKSKSGHTPRGLFDILIKEKAMHVEAPGSKLSMVDGTVHWLRNGAKAVLRGIGIPSEKVRKIVATSQNSFIESELSNLPRAKQKFFFKELLEMERQRVIKSFKKVITDLEDSGKLQKNLVTGAYLMGSVLSDDCWPDDIDCLMVVKNKIDDKTYWLIRNALEKDLDRVAPAYPITESELPGKQTEWKKSQTPYMRIGR